MKKPTEYYIDIDIFDKIRKDYALKLRLKLEKILDSETTLEMLHRIENLIYSSYNSLMLEVVYEHEEPVIKKRPEIVKDE